MREYCFVQCTLAHLYPKSIKPRSGEIVFDSQTRHMPAFVTRYAEQAAAAAAYLNNNKFNNDNQLVPRTPVPVISSIVTTHAQNMMGIIPPESLQSSLELAIRGVRTEEAKYPGCKHPYGGRRAVKTLAELLDYVQRDSRESGDIMMQAYYLGRVVCGMIRCGEGTVINILQALERLGIFLCGNIQAADDPSKTCALHCRV